MTKKSAVILLVIALWFTTSYADAQQSKQDIDPPDWYKAGMVAALQDKTASMCGYSSYPSQPIPYLSAEQKNLIIQIQTKNLTDTNPNVRCTAMQALQATLGKAAIPQINERLNDTNELVRLSAIQELEALGAKESIPVLIEHLSNIKNDLYEYGQIMNVLRTLGIEGKPISNEIIQAKEQLISNLIESLDDPNKRYNAIDRLWRLQELDLQLEKYSPKLIELLTQTGNDEEMLFRLVKLLHFKEAVPKLIDLYLNNTSLESTGLSHLIIRTIRDLPATEQMIPKFIELLAYGETRELAIQKLQSLNAKQTTRVQQKIPEIIKLLSDVKPNARLTAIAALQAFQIKEAIPNLTKLLTTDADFNVRIAVITALQNLQGKDAVPTFIQNLNSDVDPNVRIAIITALKNLQGKDAIPEFISCLDDKDPHVRNTVINVLQALKVKEAIPKLIEHLDDKNLAIRRNTILALQTLQAKEAIPELIKHLDDTNILKDLDTTELDDSYYEPNLTIVIINALKTLQAKQAIPTLIKLLDDSDRIVRFNVINALQTLQAKEAIPKLIEHLDDSEIRVRYAVIEALQHLQAKEIIPKLIQLLSSSNDGLNNTVIQALETLQAKEAIPKLIEVSIYPKTNESCTAIRALQALQTKEVFFKDTLPQIIQRSQIKNFSECPEVINALLNLPATQAISKLTELLAQPVNGSFRFEIIKTLQTLQTQEAIPILIEMAVKPDSYNDNQIYDVAMDALKTLKAEQSEKTIAQCLKLLDGKDIDSYRMIRVLNDLQVTYLIPEITEFLINNNEKIRRAALYALKDLQVKERQLRPNTFFFIAIFKELEKELEQAVHNQHYRASNRFTAHLLAGSRFQPIVWCLNIHDDQNCAKQDFQNNHAKTIATLRLLTDFDKTFSEQRWYSNNSSHSLRVHLTGKMIMLSSLLVEQQTTGKIFQDLSINTNFRAKEELALLDEIIQMLANEQHTQSQVDKALFQQYRDKISNKQTEISNQSSHILFAIGSILSLLGILWIYRHYKQRST